MFSPKLLEFARKCYLTNIGQNLLVLLKWTGFSLLSGLLIGGVSTLFATLLGKAIQIRAAYSWLLFLLPIAGLADPKDKSCCKKNSSDGRSNRDKTPQL